MTKFSLMEFLQAQHENQLSESEENCNFICFSLCVAICCCGSRIKYILMTFQECKTSGREFSYERETKIRPKFHRSRKMWKFLVNFSSFSICRSLAESVLCCLQHVIFIHIKYIKLSGTLAHVMFELGNLVARGGGRSEEKNAKNQQHGKIESKVFLLSFLV